jgi:ketosteroid isomerase-like protein/GNAT superfamily N-acetyltransferase
VPSESEEVARRFADAVTSGDREAAVALCHPDIVFDSVLGIGGRAYLGHDGVRQYFDDVASAWKEWRVEVERVAEAADGRVAIVMTMHARGKGSGVSVAERTAHIWTLRDGKLVHNEPYREPEEALRDLSLSLPPQRLALESDADAISELMRASVLDLFPRFYDERQTASAAEHIAHLDMQLIEDRTYFVHEADGEIVACGGWSRRNKLYTGSGGGDDDERLLDPATEPARVRAMFVRRDWTRRGLGRVILESCERAARDEGFKSLVLGATLPGEPLYRAFGFREVERFTLTMPDGVSLDAVGMERRVEDARA